MELRSSDDGSGASGPARVAPERIVDALVCVTLAVGTLVYLRGWPHDLMPSDEGTFLYEAKRIVDGDVVYRDFFDLIAPGPLFVMALAFRLFGVSMDTARLTMAVVHTMTVLLIYGMCRSLSVRPLLAAAAGCAYVALSFPAFPVATPHWFGAFLTLAVIACCLRTPRRARGYVAVGFVLGLLIVTQHQKGVIIAAGAVLVVALDGLMVDGRWSTRGALARLGWLAAGTAAAVGPVALYLLAAAGPQALFDALVYQPLGRYVQYTGYKWKWGHYPWVFAYRYVYPEIVRLTVLAVPLAVIRWLWLLACEDRARARSLAILMIMAVAAAASVAYNPGYSHVAMVVPVCFILAAEAAESMLTGHPHRVPLASLAAHALGVLVCFVLVRQAVDTRHTRRLFYPHSAMTAFGRIDYQNEIEIELLEAVRQRLNAAGTSELFCFTGYSGLYLTAGAHNPTRFQLLVPGYTRPEQYAEVLDTLRRLQLPYVVSRRSEIRDPKAHDPIWEYLKTHYQRVAFAPKPNVFYALFERKADDPARREQF